MAFDVARRQDLWFVCNGPISLGPHAAREVDQDSTVALNRWTQDGSGPPVQSGVGASRERSLAPVDACDGLGRADDLLRGGRSDEEVERLTGASLEQILSLRAASAAGARTARKRDRSQGRRWWT